MSSIHLALSSIRNAGLARKPFAKIPMSRMNIAFLDILYTEGFITGYQVEGGSSHLIKVYINYLNNDLPLVSSLKTVSRPGFRVYLKYSEMVRQYTGSFLILSTDIGIITGTSALKNHKGGEFLCVRYYFLFIQSKNFI